MSISKHGQEPMRTGFCPTTQKPCRLRFRARSRPVCPPLNPGFPGKRHITKKVTFGEDVVVVEWSFEANHRGPFAGRAATGTAVKLPGCGVYEFDPLNRKITAARIYFDVTTLLKQISSHQPQVFQNLLLQPFDSPA